MKIRVSLLYPVSVQRSSDLLLLMILLSSTLSRANHRSSWYVFILPSHASLYNDIFFASQPIMQMKERLDAVEGMLNDLLKQQTTTDSPSSSPSTKEEKKQNERTNK